MIGKLPSDRILQAMQAMREDDFTKQVLMPLFRAMRYDSVIYNGGPDELGADLELLKE